MQLHRPIIREAAYSIYILSKMMSDDRRPQSLLLGLYLPRMRTLRKIHSDQDLRGLPELYDIDNVLPRTDERTGDRNELGPGELREP
jgi:hypothetical protein